MSIEKFKFNEQFNLKDNYGKEYVDSTLSREMYWKKDSDLFDHFIESCFFHYLPKDCSVALGWRSAFSAFYFLKDFIKDKHLCHIGSRNGDLELLSSKYAKKITMVEPDVPGGAFDGMHSAYFDGLEKLNSNKYNCEIELVGKYFDPCHQNDYQGIDVQADIYYFWNVAHHSSEIIKHLKKIRKGKSLTIICPNMLSVYGQYPDLFKTKPETYLFPFDEAPKLNLYADKMLKKENVILITKGAKAYVYETNDGYCPTHVDTIINNWPTDVKWREDGFVEYLPEYTSNKVFSNLKGFPHSNESGEINGNDLSCLPPNFYQRHTDDELHSYKHWGQKLLGLHSDARGYLEVGVYQE